MTQDRHQQMLRDLQEEREEAERQLLALQQRVEALRKATDGVQELLRSESDVPPPEVPEDPQLRLTTKPSTGNGALIVIKSDTSRYWTVREVWEAMVARGWIANTKDARSAVRIALTRLSAKLGDELDRIDAPPTHAYRWVGGKGQPAFGAQGPRQLPGLRAFPSRRAEP